MTPEQLEALGFTKFYDDVDGTEDYMYEYVVTPGHQFYSDFISDIKEGKLEVYYNEDAISLCSEELEELQRLLKKGLTNV